MDAGKAGTGFEQGVDSFLPGLVRTEPRRIEAVDPLDRQTPMTDVRPKFPLVDPAGTDKS